MQVTMADEFKELDKTVTNVQNKVVMTKDEQKFSPENHPENLDSMGQFPGK